MKLLRFFLIVNAFVVASVMAAGPVVQDNVEPGLDEILAGDPAFVVQAQQQVDVQPNIIEKEPSDAEKLENTLKAIQQGYDSIFENSLYLNKAESLNQIEVYKLKLFVDNEIKEIKNINGWNLRSVHSFVVDWHTKRLSEIIYWFKFACINLEILTVGLDVSKNSALFDPIDFVELQQAKLNVLSELLRLYSPWGKKGIGPVALPEYSEKRVKNIVFKSLPERLQHSVWSYLFLGATQSSSQAYYLSKILSQNFYTQELILAEEYLDVVSVFYNAQKFGQDFDCELFYAKINKLILDFSVQQNCYDTRLSVVPDLLLSKLIKIKNDVAKFYKPAATFKDNPEKTKLLVRYRLLLEDKKLELFCSDKKFYEFFDLYCCVLQEYFESAEQSQATAIKLFELECKLEKLKNEKLPSWIKKFLCKKDLALSFLDEISNLLKDTTALINKSNQPKDKGFLSNVFSGDWVDAESLKNVGINGSETFVEFMESMFNRKFDSFKEAAFFLLARTSPVLAAGLVYKILPYLSGDLQSKVAELATEPENSVGGNNIFDFISKNPEIFNKLCLVKPELVNGLADIVQQKLDEVRA